MPYKANEARRHKIPRARYKVANWPEYDKALQQRGSLTVWVTPEALAAWHPPHTGRPGRPRDYSEVAIETGHLLRLALAGAARILDSTKILSQALDRHTPLPRRCEGASSYVRAQQAREISCVAPACCGRGTLTTS